MLLLRGRSLPPHDLRVLTAFATHLAVVLDRAELAAQAAEADRLEQGNRMRTALLAAVSHDLRTPLAGIKAAVSTLRTPDVHWTADDRDGPARRPSRTRPTGSRAIIANLLDLSRLQTGGVTLVPDVVGLDDVVGPGASPDCPTGDRVRLDVPDDLPAVRVDAGLLDRVVANLVDNALRHTDGDVWVTGGMTSGPGVAAGRRPRPGHPGRREGAAVRAVPAARRRAGRGGRRPRPRRRPRPDRGDGRHAHRLRHRRRRPDHDRLRCPRCRLPAPPVSRELVEP